jgi:hypothetical protein
MGISLAWASVRECHPRRALVSRVRSANWDFRIKANDFAAAAEALPRRPAHLGAEAHRRRPPSRTASSLPLAPPRAGPPLLASCFDSLEQVRIHVGMALREQPEVYEAEVSGHLCGPACGMSPDPRRFRQWAGLADR